MKKKLMSAILAAMMVASSFAMFSCSDAGSGDTDEATASDTPSASEEVVEETEPETEEIKPDLPADLKFSGSSFTFGVVDNANARNFLVMEELTGEALNDAQYSVIETAQEELDITIEQNVLTTGYPAAGSLTPLIAAGDDTIQVANVFCVDTSTLLTGGQIIGYKDVPHIDLEKPYWDKSVNNELMLGDMRYAAIGDLSISTHDLTYILLFNKQMITDLGMDSPYDLVNGGKWTVDSMAAMMEGAVIDLNGDGQWTRDDQYGYAAHSKMTLPSFWIGAGFQTIALDDAGYPQIHIGDEAFVNFFEKVFQITYDNNSKYNGSDRDAGQDVPTASRELFQEGKVLFIDCSMFWVGALRDMETDFGIIPYPKLDESQEAYHARVSYYMPPVLPATNTNLELTGAVLELTNYLAKKEVTPAYYDIALKGKVSRDEESVAMLDLIFANRVIDLGDTLFCSLVRDNFMASMYSSNQRDIVSTYTKQQKPLAKNIEKVMDLVAAP
ncbi:MAG: hypothetical protein IJP32_02440 [Clostridia bacterium]|nr:hypothetical protein [Clostridia bacterium]